MKSNKLVLELKRIARENGGLLQPEIVVEEATPATSPLHSRFTWDNTKAAHEYRLWQARHLIRVSVEEIAGVKGEHEVFVSLSMDRKDSGYRVMTEVLSDEDLRREMLKDALKEMLLFTQKYKRLKELVSVFASMRQVLKRKR